MFPFHPSEHGNPLRAATQRRLQVGNTIRREQTFSPPTSPATMKKYGSNIFKNYVAANSYLFRIQQVMWGDIFI